MFDPKTNYYPYTENTDQHYLKLRMDRGIVFDESYPYLDKSRIFRFRKVLMRIFLYVVVFPVSSIRMGLKIKGRKNLKKYKDVLDKGVVSVCNHVHMWDYFAILNAIRPYKPNVLIWDKNINGEHGTGMRLVGGIPIPENNIEAQGAFFKALDDLLSDGGWLHIYAEGSMWECYAPIRPFKRGAASIAASHDKPIIPLGFSYREPGWIRKHVFHQIALFTLHIGEPIYPDKTLTPKKREKDLTIRAHRAVCTLVGINPDENLYEPILNDSKRIDYYTSTYGVGYRGSW